MAWSLLHNESVFQLFISHPSIILSAVVRLKTDLLLTHLHDVVQVPVVIPFQLLPHAPDRLAKAAGEVAVQEQVPEGLFETLRAHKHVPGD